MIPITLKYCVTEIINVEKSQNINDINFICVEHTENGKRMFTAFIGSGENNNDEEIYLKTLNIKEQKMDGLISLS